jgi:hypothetical protein
MLNKMNILLAATAAVALSAGAASAQPPRHDDGPNSSVTVGDSAGAGYYGNGYNYGYDDAMARRDRDAHYRAEAWHAQPAGLISVDLGGIAFGYADGYWDNGHTWHRWNSRHEARAYRARYGSHYRARNHDRYNNDGWRR